MSFKKFDLAAIVLTALILALLIAPVTAGASSYEYVTKWGSLGSGNGQFDYPYGVTVDNSTGYIYVADTWNHRIQKFTSIGSYITKWGSEGSGDGQFELPK